MVTKFRRLMAPTRKHIRSCTTRTGTKSSVLNVPITARKLRNTPLNTTTRICLMAVTIVGSGRWQITLWRFILWKSTRKSNSSATWAAGKLLTTHGILNGMRRGFAKTFFQRKEKNRKLWKENVNKSASQKLNIKHSDSNNNTPCATSGEIFHLKQIKMHAMA